jgi:hypothetical protein
MVASDDDASTMAALGWDGMAASDDDASTMAALGWDE